MATKPGSMRRRIALSVTIAALVAVATVGAYVPLALTAPLDSATSSTAEWSPPVAPETDLDWPSYGSGAIGAAGYGADLAVHGDQGSRPMASISKIVTALVVLDEAPLGPDESGPVIEFTDEDLEIYLDFVRQNGSVEPVAPGSRLTQREVLELVVVPSANNYAVSLTNWVFGSQEAYVDAAAEWLDENGLDSTRLVEPTGISPRNVSSATDLVRIGMLALDTPVLAEIVSTPVISVPGFGPIESTNLLLGGNDGVDGIKTGNTEEAGSCLLFSTDVEVGGESITVVGVVLGGETRESLAAAVDGLLDDVRAGFTELVVVDEGQVFASFETEWGDSAQAVASERVADIVWSSPPVTTDVVVDDVVTATAGETVGSVTVVVDGVEQTVPLTLDAPLEAPSIEWRLSNPRRLMP
ncbi:D-alanyl-D-alanine carboxypeptidase family protein [Marisediminicola sp. LYQ134]|uniref:D-alanyl-D-alanine carboxypeptidase family protein n=1 Tax=unclassified Marisediminicola TaxID=2618316 RepID=UPI0039834F3F